MQTRISETFNTNQDNRLNANSGIRTGGRGERMGLTIKPRKECHWDLVSLGEVMVRLDPGDRRVATARSFEVCEGGGGYKGARGLERWFGPRTPSVTVFTCDPIGPLLQG